MRWIILLLMCWKSRYAVSDAAIESIFGILSTLFSYLSRIPVVPFCGVLADSFPKTVSAASRIVGLESNKFTKFIVCRHCHSLYTDEDCFQLIGLRRVSKKCDYVEFPDHPQRQHRRDLVMKYCFNKFTIQKSCLFLCVLIATEAFKRR